MYNAADRTARLGGGRQDAEANIALEPGLMAIDAGRHGACVKGYDGGFGAGVRSEGSERRDTQEKNVCNEDGRHTMLRLGEPQNAKAG